MKKNLLLFILIINSSFSFAQAILNIDGQTFTSSSTSYYAYSIARSVPTTLHFTNNTFNTVNSTGYQLLAGDETVLSTNNNLDGAVITGNRFFWNGTDNTSETHSLFTGYNRNVIIKYNYLYKSPNGIQRKANGMHNTSGGIAYNILVDPTVGIAMKGMNDVLIYNNTFFSTKSQSDTWRGIIDVYTNTDNGLDAPSTGTKIFNNIFYTEKERISINVYEPTCLDGFESDYNLYWCETGAPHFQIGATVLSFSEWQGLGYDLHSVVVNPHFIDKTDFVPAARLDYGSSLGTEWQTGLSTAAVWGTTSPATTDQNGTWQVGARVFSAAPVQVTSINVTGTGGLSSITIDNGTLQLITAVLPVNAADKTVTWTVANGTGQATINSSGLVTAVSNGTVTALATAHDGSGVQGSLVLTISNQTTPVGSITVTGAGGSSSIATDNGTLQLSASVLPANATNKTVSWSVTNGSGQATISTGGLVTAITDGTVTARATATDGSGVSGTLVITISNQVVPVTSVSVSGTGGASVITTDNGTLQLIATVLPANATNKTVTWSLSNGTGQATISTSGLVTAIADGTVIARATANDGTGVYGLMTITIASQVIPVTVITVTGAGGATSIPAENGSLQMNALVLPANATDKTFAWSVANGTGEASISSSGLLTAVSNGSVTVIATALDGSGVSGTLAISISGQIVPVTGITVTGEGGATAIFSDDGTLQLAASVLPLNATDNTVTWSIENGTGNATIDASGLVKALDNGTVTAMATANDGSGVSGTLEITISGQVVQVTDIIVTAEGGSTSINSESGVLRLNAEVLPVNATNRDITWTIDNLSGVATISTDGLVTAVENGIVKAQATANDGSGVYGTIDISIDFSPDKPYSVIVTRAQVQIIFYEDYVSWIADLYSLQGNHVMRNIVDTNILTFDISHLTPGLYLIVMSRGDRLVVEKIVIP